MVCKMKGPHPKPFPRQQGKGEKLPSNLLKSRPVGGEGFRERLRRHHLLFTMANLSKASHGMCSSHWLKV